MHFELHPDAINNFNKLADELLLLLSPIKGKSETDSFKTDGYIGHEITDKEIIVETKLGLDEYIGHVITDKEIIGEMKHGLVDFTGHEISKYFIYKGQELGIEQESYQLFYKLCESIQRNKQINNFLSLSIVKEETFEWMSSRYKGDTKLSLMEYLLPRVDSKIKDIEIWIPIFSLIIRSSFKFGRVLFQPISKTLIDKWQENAIKYKQDEEHGKNINKLYEEERKEVQGLCAGTITITAEPERASQLAFEEVERNLNLLRFYEFPNFHPMVVSHCAVIGKHNLQSIHYYIIEKETISISSTSMIGEGFHRWKLDDEMITKMYKDGLEILDSIMNSNYKTEFHKTLLDTLQIYSRSALCNNYSDRLFYLLVAVESLLLNNRSEPIQHNVAERMAFVLSKNPLERKKIVKNFKTIYDLRSDFVDHANDIESSSLSELNEFMLNVWHLLHLTIKNANNYQTKEKMIEAIENIKYS